MTTMKKIKSFSYVTSNDSNKGLITTVTTLRPHKSGFLVYIAKEPAKHLRDQKIRFVQIIADWERGLLVIKPASEAKLRKWYEEGERIAGIK